MIGGLVSALVVYAAVAMNLGPKYEGPIRQKAEIEQTHLSYDEQMAQRLKRFVAGREAKVDALYDTYTAAVGESDMGVWLGKLKHYLGSSYGLPKAEEAYRNLMKSREQAIMPDLKLAYVLSFNDALSGVLHEMPFYARDYHARSRISITVFNYQYPGREFFNELGDEMRAIYKSHADAVGALDPRLIEPRNFGGNWRPIRLNAW